jgi:hypothetical protein
MYLVLPGLTSSWRTSLGINGDGHRRHPAGAVLLSQWRYGNPFTGQHWMPDQNIYVNQGARGWTLPDPQLFLLNLFDPAFGMYTWGPLLLLALVPAWWYRTGSLVLPRRERRFVAAAWVAFLLFASANQYSRLQFNSGFRYLVPLVPFLVLAIADTWARLRWGVKVAIAAAVVFHSWVLTVYREPVLESYRLLVTEGPQLPWYRVLSMTANPANPWWARGGPALIIGATIAPAAGSGSMAAGWRPDMVSASSQTNREIVSLVVPVFNEADGIGMFYERATKALAALDGLSWEIVFIDDGSRDNSYEQLAAFAAANPRVQVLKLSRNFGHQIAISAGIDHARGNCVVIIDADLQDPPEVVASMVAKWREGFDVVYGVRSDRAGETGSSSSRHPRSTDCSAG